MAYSKDAHGLRAEVERLRVVIEILRLRAEQAEAENAALRVEVETLRETAPRMGARTNSKMLKVREGFQSSACNNSKAPTTVTEGGT